MAEENKKEIYFNLYCDQCKYKDVEETKDPCNECLSIPYGINTHKPLCFEEEEEL